MKKLTPSGRPRSPRLGVAALVVALLGVFGLTACQPLPQATALQVSLTTGSTGDPATWVSVTVYPTDDPTAPPVAHGLTDVQGNAWFTHQQLTAGDYVVQFGGGEFESWWPDAGVRSEAAALSISATEPTQITAAVAATQGHILGRVDDAEGVGIPDAVVTAYDVGTDQPVATFGTANFGNVGSYTLYKPEMRWGQAYKIGFSKPGYGTVFAGAEGTMVASIADAAPIRAGQPNLVRVNATMEPEASITGTVLPDGTNAVEGVAVLAIVAETGHVAATALTAADGTFTVSGLPGIEYHLALVDVTDGLNVMVLGAGAGGSQDPADGSTFSLQAGVPLALGTITLTSGSDCAAAQGGMQNLMSADLRNCDLSTADLSTARLMFADLSGANLSHATLPKYDYEATTPATMDRAVLVGANLSHADAYEPGLGGLLNIYGANLTAADLSHADFEGAGAMWSNLRGANLSHTNLLAADLDETDLSGADLSAPTFGYTTAQRLVLAVPPRIPDGYRLVGDDLFGAGLRLQNVDLSGIDLSGMNLADVTLTTVDLTGADLTDTILTDLTWNGVNITGADLSGATISVNWSGHNIWDATTVFPEGWTMVNGSFVPN